MQSIKIHINLLYLSLFLITSFTTLAEWKAPMPPGWKDTSTEIEFWGGKLSSNPVEGYTWSINRGPDFDVIYFQNGAQNADSAGFYIGNHPMASIAVSTKDLGTKPGKLNGQSVLWVKRPTNEEDNDKYKYETIIRVKKASKDSPELKLHFWLILNAVSNDAKWLNWAESVKLELN